MILSLAVRDVKRFRKPYCPLHRQTIRDHLPPGCPLAEASAYRALLSMQDRAYRLLADRGGDRGAALELLHDTATCEACIPELIRDPRVRGLRETPISFHDERFSEASPAVSDPRPMPRPMNGTGRLNGHRSARRPEVAVLWREGVQRER